MVKFLLTISAIDPLSLPPYKGSTFRGGFGHAFKKTVCTIRNKECNDCILKSRCIYSYVFETPPPEDSQILRKYEKAPHPFIIEPPLETKTHYKPGDALSFGLVLLGKAAEYLPYFIYTFEELGNIGIGKGKGKYQLLNVSCEGREIYNSVDRKLFYNAPRPPLGLRGGGEGGGSCVRGITDTDNGHGFSELPHSYPHSHKRRPCC